MSGRRHAASMSPDELLDFIPRHPRFYLAFATKLGYNRVALRPMENARHSKNGEVHDEDDFQMS